MPEAEYVWRVSSQHQWNHAGATIYERTFKTKMGALQWIASIWVEGYSEFTMMISDPGDNWPLRVHSHPLVFTAPVYIIAREQVYE